MTKQNTGPEGQESFQPYAADAQKNRKALGCAVFIVLALIVFILIPCVSMKRTFAHRQTYALNTEAKNVFYAASAYQQELRDAGLEPQLRTTILNLKDDRKSSTLFQGMHKYKSDLETISFAVICDSEGNVTGAMSSRGNITEYDLTHPQTFAEQREYLRSVFRSRKAIGSYLNGSSPEP